MIPHTLQLFYETTTLYALRVTHTTLSLTLSKCKKTHECKCYKDGTNSYLQCGILIFFSLTVARYNYP